MRSPSLNMCCSLRDRSYLALGAPVLQPLAMKPTAILLALAVSACAAAPSTAPVPADAFLARLNELCGKRFEGKVVTNDPLDADFASQRLVMHVRDCSADEV